MNIPHWLVLPAMALMVATALACADDGGSQPSDAGTTDTDTDSDSDSDTDEEVVQWPFDDDVPINVMNTISTLQFYSEESIGFHHGLDLRAESGTEVYAPVSGLVGTRYYFWIENDYTYEIWIETDEGVHYEIHHIDKSTIPQEIEDLASGGGSVEQGAFLGNVFHGPDMGVESHIHINVPTADEWYQNPLTYLPGVPDGIAPTLNRVYFVDDEADPPVEIESCAIEPDVARCSLVLDAHDNFDSSDWDHSLYELEFYLRVEDDWQLIWGFEFDQTPYQDYLVGADEIYRLEPFEDLDGAAIDNQIETTADRRFLYALPLDLESVPNETSSEEMRIVARDFAGNETDETFSLTGSE